MRLFRDKQKNAIMHDIILMRIFLFILFVIPFTLYNLVTGFYNPLTQKIDDKLIAYQVHSYYSYNNDTEGMMYLFNKNIGHRHFIKTDNKHGWLESVTGLKSGTLTDSTKNRLDEYWAIKKQQGTNMANIL